MERPLTQDPRIVRLRRLNPDAPPVATRAQRRAAPAVASSARTVLSELALRTRYVDPALLTDWPRIVGVELGGLSRPGRLSGGRSATLEVVARDSAAAAKVRFEAAAILKQVNTYLGPGAVGQIRVKDGRGEAAGASLVIPPRPHPNGPGDGGPLARFRSRPK